jgi:hypothetical protein
MCLQPQFDGCSAKRKRQRRAHFHDHTVNPYSLDAVVKRSFTRLTGYEWQGRRGQTDLKKFSAVSHQTS